MRFTLLFTSFIPLASQPKDSPGAIRVIQVTVAQSHRCKLKYLTDYVRALNVTKLEVVYVCLGYNFATFKRPRPESRTYLGSTSRLKICAVARAEHKQYNALLAVMQEIWEVQRATKSTLDPPSIDIRTVRMNNLFFVDSC